MYFSTLSLAISAQLIATINGVAAAPQAGPSPTASSASPATSSAAAPASNTHGPVFRGSDINYLEQQGYINFTEIPGQPGTHTATVPLDGGSGAANSTSNPRFAAVKKRWECPSALKNLQIGACSNPGDSKGWGPLNSDVDGHAADSLCFKTGDYLKNEALKPIADAACDYWFRDSRILKAAQISSTAWNIYKDNGTLLGTDGSAVRVFAQFIRNKDGMDFDSGLCYDLAGKAIEGACQYTNAPSDATRGAALEVASGGTDAPLNGPNGSGGLTYVLDVLTGDSW